MEFKRCAKNSQEAKNIEKAYSFLRSIADSNRLKIICLLRDRPMCVCEIAPAIDISDKLASHHLKELKKIGILKEKREGNFIRYSLDKPVLREHKKVLDQITK